MDKIDGILWLLWKNATLEQKIHLRALQRALLDVEI